ncbi:SipW-dependent-type signal peptide-containing protein [Microbacterium sp.]|uniref:SipW-dependent-type signal peptide-containing protein n=1 Tax=Microbacterium sp. TaxID=51671 RepID=UPI0027356EE7|nr:SipW-dependent-type signal peptide-containing protein [Microbacterium sp.]MDP3950403.1 SipW-dependent-type signal peptide-containing protein [Microbacterium sp.]
MLAAGVVLGVGAASTLAAWNDSEFTQADFTAGRFGIVGATNGATFSEHATAATAAALSFQLPATTAAMAPGNTVYALFSVKTLNPSVAGTVQLTADGANGAGLGAHLRYSVRTIPGTTCNATPQTGETVIVPAGSTLTTGATLTQTLTANGASQVNYCFAVTLPTATPNAAQGLGLTARWTFTAMSS